MDRLLNALKAQSGAQDSATGQPRYGTVTSVNQAEGTVRVLLQPEGVLTGWLPVLSPWVGDGWGLSCPPSPGDQVLVLPQEGDAEHGMIIARTWSQSAAVPATPVGELWLTHRSGSFLRLVNDGTIQMQGDLHVNGDVYDRHGSIAQLRGHYNEHKHGDPQGGSVSAPDQID